MSVQRYIFGKDALIPVEDGALVLYTDYSALQRQHAALEAKVTHLQWSRDDALNHCEKLSAQHDALVAERDALAVQVEGLQKDAERYRFLRDSDQVEVYFATKLNPSGWGAWNGWDDKDAAIDAAIAQEPRT